MTLFDALVALLVFPGLLYAAPAGWLMLWTERKAVARMQGRIGPPFFQPFYDFVKLLAKRPVPRPPVDAVVMTVLPVLAVGSLLGALALLPVTSTSTGFAGDLILLVALLEIPAICIVLAGFASRSVFGQVGATREAILSITYNVPFLMVLVALAASAGSLRVNEIATAPGGAVRYLALLTILLTLPVKLRLNPFSLANAEQEIYAGATTEYDGPRLAMWELAHALEWVALAGLVAVLSVPARSGQWWLDAALFVVISFVVVVALSVVAAATARLKVRHAARFYWRWGLSIAALSLALALLPRFWG